jgi:hypothetical protein
MRQHDIAIYAVLDPFIHPEPPPTEASPPSEPVCKLAHVTAVNFLRAKRIFVIWVVVDCMSFRGATSDRFVTLLKEFNEKARLYAPTSASTAQKWVIEIYREEKERLRYSLSTAASAVNTS